MAIICVVLGLYTAQIIYTDYKAYHKNVVHFESASSTLADMGSILSGSAGLLITLGGIILLLLTIYQTQTELSDTRTLMNTQLVESTFFNLLKNHKDVVLGMNEENFDKAILACQLKLHNYFVAEKSGYFENFNLTKFSPEPIYKSSQDFQNIGKSILHIAKLIETSIEKDKRDFYHTTLLYNLSESEKFLFGMIIMNDLEPDVEKFKHKYTSTYNSRSSVNKNNVSVPLIAISFTKMEVYVPDLFKSERNTELFKDCTRFNLMFGSADVNLLDIKFRVRKSKEATDGGTISMDYDPKGLNFSGLVKEDKFMKPLAENSSIIVEFIFEFKHKDKSFTIVDECIVEKEWRTSGGIYTASNGALTKVDQKYGMNEYFAIVFYGQ